MVEAPVGFQCPVCIDEARRRRPIPRTSFGARAGNGKPVVTYTVIAACLVVYLFQILPGYVGPLAGVLPDLTNQFSYIPAFTAAWNPFFEPWRMLTSALLHHPGNAMHIAFNMLALWFVGRVMEPEIGRTRFAVLLLLSAFGGSVAILFSSVLGLSHPFGATVGASGAVFGLFGALFILMRSSGGQTGGIVALLLINMVVSFLVPNISWQGHLGGLITGALVALIIAKAPRKNRVLWQSLGLAGLGAVLLILTAFGVQGVPLP
ncbi:rhomboid family intramembrane serine protease [Nesterenkonia muleiensis]|uniref:rhomboid family intramembrane serine protease n=1 Tax=Nesterenkonia muleiensis TaxID=2282648 RepID=UPI001EE447F2|nr:rhomboid family intramembrane serine protease [Nesterenkonia muleiensis]